MEFHECVFINLLFINIDLYIFYFYITMYIFLHPNRCLFYLYICMYKDIYIQSIYINILFIILWLHWAEKMYWNCFYIMIFFGLEIPFFFLYWFEFICYNFFFIKIEYWFRNKYPKKVLPSNANWIFFGC